LQFAEGAAIHDGVTALSGEPPNAIGIRSIETFYEVLLWLPHVPFLIWQDLFEIQKERSNVLCTFSTRRSLDVS
jgi:hypothetical protein